MSRYPRKPAEPKLPLDEAPDFMSVPELARVIGISRGMAYQLIREGKIHSFRLGRRVIVRKATLADLGNPPRG